MDIPCKYLWCYCGNDASYPLRPFWKVRGQCPLYPNSLRTRVVESETELEVFGRRWIPKGTRIRTRCGCQIFFSDTGSPIGSILHHTFKLEIPVKMVQFLLKLLLKHNSAVYHDFHWLLVATKLFTAKHHSCHVRELESEILERSELDSESDI